MDPDPINTSDENLNIDLPLHNQTMDIIQNEFQGAPEQIEKIFIPYAKRAKPVDMRQLKTQCWRLIGEFSKDDTTIIENHHVGKVEFTEVYDKLPSILTKSMAENVSIGLAFYSVLHLVNEKSLMVAQHKDLNGFTIVKPDEEDD